MSEQTVPMWLDNAAATINRQKAEETQKWNEARQRKIEKDNQERTRKLYLFQESLAKILGQDAADELIPINFDDQGEPFVRSGAYRLEFCEKRAANIWRIYVVKEIPERLRDVCTGYRWVPNAAEDMGGVARAIRDIADKEKRAEEAFARKIQEEERIEEIVPVNPPAIVEPVNPTLTGQQRDDVHTLRFIAVMLETGGPLTPMHELILATIHAFSALTEYEG